MNLRNPLLSFLPFWLFIILFKAAASLHYTIFPVLGERLFPVWVVGLIVSAAAVLQMILDVPAGYLLDRFGYVRGVRIATTVFALGVGMFLFGLHPWTIFASLLLSVVGWLFFGPGVYAYVLAKADKRIAGRFMAARDIASSSGTVIGMAILPLLLHASVPWIAVVLGSFFILSILALSRTPKDATSVHEQKKIAHQSFYIRRHFIHHVIRAMKTLNPVSSMLMIQRFSAALFYGIVWFVVPLMIDRVAQKGPLQFGLIAFDLAVLVTGFIFGKLTDTWNKRWLIFWGMLIFSVSAILLGFNFGILFVLLGFMATSGDEMASISLWAWLDALDKTHAEDGLVSGALTLAEDLGWAIGPLLAGIAFETVGPTWTIVFGAIFITCAWIASSILMLPSAAHVPIPVRSEHIPHVKPHKR